MQSKTTFLRVGTGTTKYSKFLLILSVIRTNFLYVPIASPWLALKGEKQENVNACFFVYKFLYGTFDKIIYKLDGNAEIDCEIPNWLMTCISTFGLGFQLLLISAMLVLGLIEFILYFFLIYTVFVFIFIGIRKVLYRKIQNYVEVW